MNPEVERLFGQAVGLDETQRQAFLAENCSNPEVRKEVQLLLAHDQGAESFLRNVVLSEASEFHAALSPGQRLGVYRVLSVLAQGGMGLVYLCERADGKFEQRVAVKVLQSRFASQLMGDRILHECRILASLEHPNIARVLDIDVTQDALPYFVMEYVDGQPIDRYCDRHKISVRDRLRLLLPICDAVLLAHQKLIVHRDLKPDNILVTEQGIPKLLDFGIAKVLSAVPSSAENTATHVLTPEYASPEQARGEPVTTATDVYSLGGVLYTLLTQVTPHQLGERSPLAMVQAICNEEVRRPSEIRQELSGDLDSILLKALHADPQRRYRSVDQFAADIERLLEGKPVLARPDTVWYRLGKFVRRHWLGMSAAITVLLALTLGITLAVWQARRAERRFADVRQLANVFLFDLEQSIHNTPGTTKARQLLVSTALEYLQRLSKEASGDPGLLKELAAAYEKVGDIQGNTDAASTLGNTAAAIPIYQQSVSMWKAVQRSRSHDQSTDLALARTLDKLARVRTQNGDLLDSKLNLIEAISLSSKVLKSNPGDRSSGRVVVDSKLDMARVKLKEKDQNGALNELASAVALQEVLSSARTSDPGLSEDLARTYTLAASNLERMFDYDGALSYSRKAVASYERLLAQHPDSIEVRNRMINALTEEATEISWGSNNSPSQALPVQRRAYVMAGELVNEDPSNPMALFVRVTVGLRLIGNMLTMPHPPEDLRTTINDVLPFTQELVRRDPHNTAYLVDLGICYTYQGLALSHRHGITDPTPYYESAAKVFETLATLAPNDPVGRHAQVQNWALLADCYLHQGKWGTAHQICSTAFGVAEKLPQSSTLAPDLTNLRKIDNEALRHLSPAR